MIELIQVKYRNSGLSQAILSRGRTQEGEGDKHVQTNFSLKAVQNTFFLSIRLQWKRHWFLYEMVTHFTMRTYGVNQAFQFVKGIWLHRKSRQIRFFSEKDLFYIIRAHHALSYHLK